MQAEHLQYVQWLLCEDSLQNGAHALKLKSPAFAEEQATDEVDDLTLLEFFLEPTPAEVDIFLHG